MILQRLLHILLRTNSASPSPSLAFTIASSVAVMSSIDGILSGTTAKFIPLASKDFSLTDRGRLDRFFTHLASGTRDGPANPFCC